MWVAAAKSQDSVKTKHLDAGEPVSRILQDRLPARKLLILLARGVSKMSVLSLMAEFVARFLHVFFALGFRWLAARSVRAELMTVAEMMMVVVVIVIAMAVMATLVVVAPAEKHEAKKSRQCGGTSVAVLAELL